MSRLTGEKPGAPKNWKALRQFFEAKNWAALANEILEFDPSLRVCGAEINTIEESRKKGILSLESLFFLVSDTEYGVGTGELLKNIIQKEQILI